MELNKSNFIITSTQRIDGFYDIKNKKDEVRHTEGA